MKQDQLYTVRQFLEAAEIDVESIKDYREYKIGGLGFDYLDSMIRIPHDAETVAITRHGEIVDEITVDPS